MADFESRRQGRSMLRIYATVGWVGFDGCVFSPSTAIKVLIGASGFPPAQLLFNCCVALTHCRYVNNYIK